MRKSLKAWAGLWVMASLSACSSQDGPPAYDWQTPPPSQMLASYLAAQSTPDSLQKSQGIPIYQDFTFGIKVALQNPNARAFYDVFLNSLRIEQLEYHILANDSIASLQGRKDDIFAKVKRPETYSESYAPLEKALDEIVAHNQSALFITDGELWDKQNGESDRPWARAGLAKWLQAGNRITFYVTDHVDAGKVKHLFYMVFTPKAQIGSSQDLSQDIAYALANNVAAQGLKYETFQFQSASLKIETRYATENSGGIAPIAEVEPSYHRDSLAQWEYASVALGWNDMMTYLAQAADSVTGNPVPGGLPLLRQLWVDGSSMQFYRIDKLAIEVRDLWGDFSSFSTHWMCAALPPKFQTDAQGRVEKDPQSGMPLVLDYGYPGCYDEQGKLLAAYAYQPSVPAPSAEIFTLDEKLFQYGWERDHKAEIAIKFHPNFNGSQISAEHENFLRIDIVVAQASPLTAKPELEKFIWEGKRLPRNKAMYESILMAMQDANPTGQRIYSYFIKTPANDYNP